MTIVTSKQFYSFNPRLIDCLSYVTLATLPLPLACNRNNNFLHAYVWLLHMFSHSFGRCCDRVDRSYDVSATGVLLGVPNSTQDCSCERDETPTLTYLLFSLFMKYTRPNNTHSGGGETAVILRPPPDVCCRRAPGFPSVAAAESGPVCPSRKALAIKLVGTGYGHTPFIRLKQTSSYV